MARLGRTGPSAGRRAAALAGWRRYAVGLLALLVSFLAAGAVAGADEPTVVVSIKPLHSLVTSVMEGVGVPLLLVEGAASPHAWTLKPSQSAVLSDADLVVWVGAGLETFLMAPMESLVPAGHGLALSDVPEVALLPVREGGVWEPHHHEGEEHADEEHADEDHADEEHADEEHEHDHAGYDPHLWLDPVNAIAIARAVATRLAEIDPAHADLYAANLAALTDRLVRLDEETRAILDPVRDRPFIVFHDAYQYFERRYALAGAGSITLDPEQAPGAARLAAVRARLEAGGIVCAFAEPLFDPALLETAVEGTPATIASLDPEGVDLAPGPDLYFQLIGDIATGMAACLSAHS